LKVQGRSYVHKNIIEFLIKLTEQGSCKHWQPSIESEAVTVEVEMKLKAVKAKKKQKVMQDQYAFDF
jgi:hypothetical protein